MRHLDKQVHSETRLFIMLKLFEHSTLSFKELQKKLHISSGTLNSHLKKLSQVKYIEQEKKILEDKPLTLIHLKPKGSHALHKYAEQLITLFKNHKLDNGGLS
ncbi:MAG: hypothetical protein CVV50_01150 [Spirochaetae bacterium HGW-Spirochaetae-6]|nr:MAG: hypothetical protein CVV50_01150 [Spirochaetae bacterium HGW-Spirochaetae-6]